MMKKALVLLAVCAAGAALAETNLVATWENTWSWAGSDGTKTNSVATQAPLAAGTATSDGNWNYFINAASGDGTFGNMTNFQANISTTNNNDGYMSTNDEELYIDFSIDNTAGYEYELVGFHFDARGRQQGSPTHWTLEVLSGDITTGFVVTNGVLTIDYGPSPYPGHDVDLSGLADNVLDATGSAVFRLYFSGGDTNSGSFYTDLDNVAIVANVTTAPPELGLYVGWENWAMNTIAASQENGGTGLCLSAGWAPNFRAGCTNGTYGDLSTNVAMADVVWEGNTNFNYTGLRAVSSTNNAYLDFVVTETSGKDVDLAYFHFDESTRGQGGPTSWSLEVLPGSSISTGLVFIGSPAVGFGQNLADFDVALLPLVDSTLDANSTVTFRLTFAGATANKNIDFDNVGVSRILPAVDYNSLITSYVLNPGGTSSIAFTGGYKLSYMLKASTDLVNGVPTTITPTLATEGTLDGDVITTDAGGKAAVEFTDAAAASQFYLIESAP